MNGFTGNETKILNALADGKAHPRDELLLVLDPDGLCSRSLLQQTVFTARKKLLLKDETIVCELSGRTVFYRHVRLITSGDS